MAAHWAESESQFGQMPLLTKQKRLRREELEEACAWFDCVKKQFGDSRLIVFAEFIAQDLCARLRSLDGVLKQGAELCGLHGRDRCMGGAAFGRDAFPQYGDGFLGALCQLARAYKCANGKLLGVVRRHAHLYCGLLHRFDKVEDVGWTRARNRRDCI